MDVTGAGDAALLAGVAGTSRSVPEFAGILGAESTATPWETGFADEAAEALSSTIFTGAGSVGSNPAVKGPFWWELQQTMAAKEAW